eukprot:COSAG04_NODE_6088_length_1414_cov_8.095817_2_plen_75_part_01
MSTAPASSALFKLGAPGSRRRWNTLSKRPRGARKDTHRPPDPRAAPMATQMDTEREDMMRLQKIREERAAKAAAE